MRKVAAISRLVTHVDITDRVPDTCQISISARHEAELVDGGRLLLLDDRGWTSLPSISAISKGPGDDSWQRDVAERVELSVEEIERTARVVVGPDEPYEEQSREEAEAAHWAHLAAVLARHGVVVDAEALRSLPHDVVLSGRLLARVGRP
jgi:hypothetical protein